VLFIYTLRAEPGQGIWVALLILVVCGGIYFFMAIWSGKRFEQQREKIAHSIS
jgi:hypothetical protein